MKFEFCLSWERFNENSEGHKYFTKELC
jgi:hypothetical protein